MTAAGSSNRWPIARSSIACSGAFPISIASCLLLYEHEGFSCAEIAEVFSVSPSAVKMRLMRARERFITLYKEETGKEKTGDR